MLGLSTRDLENVLDTVNCLQLAAHRILLATNTEFRLFQAFSDWLRYEIDTQVADPSSSENAEKDANIDHARTLEYIQGPMTQSQLYELFNLSGHKDASIQWDLAAEGRSLFELYKKEYKNTNSDGSTVKHLPGLEELIQHLDSQCEIVFSKIAETQRRSVRFGGQVAIGAGTPACMDMTILSEVGLRAIANTEILTNAISPKTSEPPNSFITYVVLGPRNKQSDGEMCETYGLTAG